MIVENKIGQDFDSLSKRILYSYVATYPDFKPVDNGVNYESQKQMHDFLADTLLFIYEHNEILGVTNQPDAYYETWALNNSNPALIQSMEKIEGKFADFIEVLIKIGRLGELKEDKLVIPKDKWSLTKPVISKLELLGIHCEQTKEESTLWIEKYPKIFPSWKSYSENDDLNLPKLSRIMAFIHGRYFGRKYKAIDYFRKLINDSNLLERLEDFLEASNFEYNNFDRSAKTRYAEVKWRKDYPKNEYAYMRAYFNWRKKDQMFYEFRLPQFRSMLNSYNDMEKELQTFVFDRLKTCDHCGYCTQTDKSGKRPCLAMDLSCNGETLSKCPLYPNLTWNDMNANDLNRMLSLFELSESLL